MPEPTEKPVGPAADLETRRLAQAHVADVFDDETTDNSAAEGVNPKDEGVQSDKEIADLTGEDQSTKDEPTESAAEQRMINALEKIAAKNAPVKETVKVKELTPEEISRELGEVLLSDEDYAEVLDPTKGKTKLQALLRAAGANGAKMAAVLLETRFAQIAPLVQELHQHQQQQRFAAEEAKFKGEYPALDKEEYQEVLEIVTEKLAKEPADKQPKSAAERRKKVAEEAEKWIKRVNPAFSLSSAPVTQKPKSTIPIPRQAVGAGAGSGGGGGNGHGKPEPVEPGAQKRTSGTELWD